MPRTWANWSLRGRLALIGFSAMLTALVVGGLAMYSAAEVQDAQMLDARLEQLGSTILSFVENGLAPERLADQVHLKTRPASALLYRYQVWTTDGTLVLRSHEAPAARPYMVLTQFGFGNAQHDGEEFRIYAVPSRDGHLVVQVAESIEDRAEQLGALTAHYVGFLLMPFGLILAGTWLLLRRALRSVDSIARQLRNRNPLDASALKVVRPPEEMLPIVRSLDAMFRRIRHALSVERRFTSVAAHELRTPLAGLRAHAQLAMRATSAEESQESLQAVLHGVDRASHLLTQLLDIAKIEALAEESAPHLQLVDLKQIYFDALKDLMPAAQKKNVVVTEDVRVTEVQGLPFGIFLMLRNLLANAVLYCPPGGSVRFATFTEGGCAALTIDDSGPGIPAEDRERAFERFNRLSQHDTRGVGLGLSIVLMVVELHGAKISLHDSPLGGLRCKVVFGAPVADLESFGTPQRLVPA